MARARFDMDAATVAQRPVYGDAELKAAHDTLFASALMAGAPVKVAKHTIRMITADVALSQAPMVIRPKSGLPMLGYSLDMLKKVDRKWLILEAHPMLFSAPPASPSE